jgi:hypothetical protein
MSANQDIVCSDWAARRHDHVYFSSSESTKATDRKLFGVLTLISLVESRNMSPFSISSYFIPLYENKPLPLWNFASWDFL